jgi:hypothetical protein
VTRQQKFEIYKILIDKTFSLFSVLGKTGVLAYAAIEIIPKFAGLTTLADISLAFDDGKDGVFFKPIWCILALIGLAFWGFMERSFRKSKTEKIHARIRDLELMIHPSRQSSGILPSGLTNPNDN